MFRVWRRRCRCQPECGMQTRYEGGRGGSDSRETEPERLREVEPQHCQCQTPPHPGYDSEAPGPPQGARAAACCRLRDPWALAGTARQAAVRYAVRPLHGQAPAGARSRPRVTRRPPPPGSEGGRLLPAQGPLGTGRHCQAGGGSLRSASPARAGAAGARLRPRVTRRPPPPGSEGGRLLPAQGTLGALAGTARQAAVRYAVHPLHSAGAAGAQCGADCARTGAPGDQH